MALVTLERRDHIARLTMNRPDALNSLNSQVLSDLERVLEEIERTPEIRAVVLTGAGRDFGAGADLSEMRRFSPEEGVAFSARGSGILRRLERLAPPVIAAVNGCALGGGLELAMACDIRLAARNAMFSMPETGLGILPGFGGTQLLPRLCGASKAMELIYTGRVIDAEEALSIGLISGIYAAEEVVYRAEDLAEAIGKNAPLAVQAAKRCIRAGLAGTAFGAESEAFGQLCGTRDRNEGMDAFQERRRVKQFLGE